MRLSELGLVGLSEPGLVAFLGFAGNGFFETMIFSATAGHGVISLAFFWDLVPLCQILSVVQNEQ